MSPRENQIVTYYLNNLLAATTADEMNKKICSWFEDHAQELIGYDVEDLWERRYASYRRSPEENALPPKSIRTIQDQFLRGKQGRLYKSPKVAAIMSVFQLAPKFEPFIELLVHAANIPMLESLIEGDFRRDEELYILCITGMLRISRSEYKKFFCHDSELFTKGLFRVDCRNGSFMMNSNLRQVMISYCETPKAICQTVLGKRMKGKLTAKNFSYMAEEYEWVKEFLAKSLKKRQTGINILIDGAPGVGKTEIVKAICHEIGVSLYSVSENSRSDADTIDRRDQLALSQALLTGDTESILMVDEAEDLFKNQGAPSAMFRTSAAEPESKLVMNRLLENHTVPVIWITNSIRGVNPAYLRRFSYILRMDRPDKAAQAKIWKSAARRHKFSVPKIAINEFVKKYDLPPSIIDTALRTAKVMDNHEAIEKTITSLLTILPQNAKKNAEYNESIFLPELFNTDQNLDELTQQIISSKKLNFSFCLYGVPGSGKSAYARFLADKLGLGVLQKRGSDILGCYVGETEANIAAAFREAKAKKMILVFDEADSFLQDRRKAKNSWEITCVNEMLTQMESHPMPFFCTTNLMEDLDQASLRRFMFKVKYKYLSNKQVRIAFRHFFKKELPKRAADDLNCLTPGDFDVVAKKNSFANITDPNKLVELLRLEQSIKDDGKQDTSKIGFLT